MLQSSPSIHLNPYSHFILERSSVPPHAKAWGFHTEDFDEIRDNTDESEETQETDLLLALVGTLQWDVAEIKKRLRTYKRPEIRVVEGAYKDHPDPLIVLAGTLQCDVTDIGERHDDYIAATLLAELWGDADE